MHAHPNQATVAILVDMLVTKPMKPTVDESCQQLAARYLRRQIKQLTAQIEGIRKAEDVEFVHRARVASRRLRAALELFGDCFTPDQAQAWNREIRGVGRGLGDARDKDVQIEFLRGALAQELPRECVAGIARVLVRWERKREKLQPKVVGAMTRLLASRALHQMLSVTKKMLPEGKKAEDFRPSPALFRHAEKHVLIRLHQLLSLRECLADPQAIPQHHAMRIAAKQLRYTLEICRPLYAGRVDGMIDAVKQAQTLLGDLRDCDIWVEQLSAMLEKQAKRLRRLYGHLGPLAGIKAGIEHLQQERRQRRCELFRSLVEYWEKLGREGVWDKLVEIVRTRGEPPEKD